MDQYLNMLAAELVKCDHFSPNIVLNKHSAVIAT